MCAAWWYRTRNATRSSWALLMDNLQVAVVFGRYIYFYCFIYSSPPRVHSADSAGQPTSDSTLSISACSSSLLSLHRPVLYPRGIVIHAVNQKLACCCSGVNSAITQSEHICLRNSCSQRTTGNPSFGSRSVVIPSFPPPPPFLCFKLRAKVDSLKRVLRECSKALHEHVQQALSRF